MSINIDHILIPSYYTFLFILIVLVLQAAKVFHQVVVGVLAAVLVGDLTHLSTNPRYGDVTHQF